MSGGPERAGVALARWFVRPTPPGERPAGTDRPASASRHPLAIVTTGRSALAVAASAALAHGGAQVSALACWHVAGAERARAVAALPAARRLAASLVARDLAAVASGRLVRIQLPDAERDALGALGRAEAACGSIPCVLALGGARGAGWDPVLAACDLVLVHGDDPELTALAVARLADAGVRAVAAPAAPSPPVRALAAAGLSLRGAAGRRSDRMEVAR